MIPFPQVVGCDEDGIIREIHTPIEAEGLELIELTGELQRLLVFESYINRTVNNGFKRCSPIYRYKDYLISKSVEMTELEADYCARRIKRIGYTPKPGFWYFLKKEIKDAIMEKDSNYHPVSTQQF